MRLNELGVKGLSGRAERRVRHVQVLHIVWDITVQSEARLSNSRIPLMMGDQRGGWMRRHG